MNLEQAMQVIEHKLRLVREGRRIESEQLYDALRVILANHKRNA